MKKFAANYVISGSGALLKNGIVIANDEGIASEYIDTNGDLDEMALLSFHNGIALAGFIYVKTTAEIPVPVTDPPVRLFLFQKAKEQSKLLVQQWLEVAKQVQEKFAEMKIPEIVSQINDILVLNGGYIKEDAPGIYIINADLAGLHFTPKSRLKRIG